MGGLVQPPPAARAHRKRTAGRSRSALLRSEGGACPSRVIQAKTPPRNPERFKMVEAGDLKSYFAQARTWEQDRLLAAYRSQRIAWVTAGVASLLAVVSVGAVAALTPL